MLARSGDSIWSVGEVLKSFFFFFGGGVGAQNAENKLKNCLFASTKRVKNVHYIEMTSKTIYNYIHFYSRILL